ncbi:MAG: 1-acyl-sn-glycerol-3-phosphate acyltransferase [Coriobacteriia bacterium]|nr:1-acyl-sn-glycerol-3-phosphate acyltransferase [Coriobacteriia bacterium]
MKKILYYFGLIQLLLFQACIFKTKTYYEEGATRTKRIGGSAIIISNHRSFLDGIAISLHFFFNRLHFIVADFYQHRLKALKPLISTAGGIFVSRDGSSLAFIGESKKVTAKGQSIMIFPEGGYQSSFEPSEFSAGYLLLAARTGAKIIPLVNDFNYGLFKRTHFMIGASIDLSSYGRAELTKAKIRELNDEISNKFLLLFYQLKRKKAEKFCPEYVSALPQRGDVVRVMSGTHSHYGVYLNASEVIQFGHATHETGESAVVNSVSFEEFCGAEAPEVRRLAKGGKRFVRNSDDMEAYAKSCIGQGGYSSAQNNCLDFANRVTLKI